VSIDVTSGPELYGTTDFDSLVDPYAVYRRLRRERPVLPVDFAIGVTWILTRFADVRDALRNDALFSNRSNARGIGLVMGRTIVEMDGREHLRHRSLVTPALAPRALKGDFPARTEAVAHDLIDRFAGRGSADLVADFTFTYPLTVFCQILGIPDADSEQVHRWAIELIGIARNPARGLAAARTLGEYLAPVVAERRHAPTGDLVSRLAHAEVDGERLGDEEVVSFLRLLVLAGAETTYHLLGSALSALLQAPEALEAVRADRSLVPAVLHETLRWESPVQLVTREATEAVTIAGVEIPAGAPVSLVIGSANRDETVFPDPDRWDLERGPVEHVGFGYGKHYCAGSRLAELEARIGLEALLDRLPELALEPGADARVRGVAFRGPTRLPVRFRPESAAPVRPPARAATAAGGRFRGEPAAGG
jgi:cytochrome P450